MFLKNVYNFYFVKKRNGKFISLTQKQYDCYNYSIGPLSAICKAKSDYLLYFTEDCIFDGKSARWIDNGIDLINRNQQFIAARPMDNDLDNDFIPEYETINDFYIGYMFTDRMFLGDLSVFRTIDYNCQDQGKYPPYGGAGFEARVFNYMNKFDKRIVISSKDSYLHEYEEYINLIDGVNKG